MILNSAGTLRGFAPRPKKARRYMRYRRDQEGSRDYGMLGLFFEAV
jgi:hypothetical protein